MPSDFKDLFTALQGMGKTIDKQLNSNLDMACEVGDIEGVDLLPVAIDQLYRDGRLDLGKKLTKQCGLKTTLGEKQFIEIHNTLKSLRQKDVEPCLHWLVKHRNRCGIAVADEIDDLTFDLHGLQYVEILQSVAEFRTSPNFGERKLDAKRRALEYAREHFSNALPCRLPGLYIFLLFLHFSFLFFLVLTLRLYLFHFFL